jgi:uncharacterized membrane protein
MSDRRRDGHHPRAFLRRSVITGTAIVVPVLVTVIVLFVALDFVAGLISPLVIPIEGWLGGGGEASLLAHAIAVLLAGGLILVVGAITESQYAGHRIEQGIEAVMALLPGIGSIYDTLDQISEMLLESDTDSFQEVVLVEYPSEGSYSVAFKTADPPDEITEVAGSDDMMTVFMPMGPNPVMGGFILYIREDRVHDVDMGVEEGLGSIVSFGVALDEEAEGIHGSGAHHHDEYASTD